MLLLYHGSTASSTDQAKRLRSKLKSNLVNKEASAATQFLRSHSAVRSDKIGVVGFSLGAYYALGLAGLRPNDVSAVVAFYGARTMNYAKTKAAYLGHFAEDDKWPPVKKTRQLEEKIRSAGREVTFYIYPGTKHWFFEEDQPDAYNRNAAGQAWGRTVEFLRTKLA